MRQSCVYTTKSALKPCGKLAFGNPPLCSKHVRFRSKIEEELQDAQANNMLASALGALLTHPSIGGIVGRVNGLLDKATGFVQDVKDGKWQPPLGAPPNPGPNQSRQPPPKTSSDAFNNQMAREIMGFKADEKLDATKIKDRKRNLAKIYHPDIPGNDPTMMRRINAAADVLLKGVK